MSIKNRLDKKSQECQQMLERKSPFGQLLTNMETICKPIGIWNDSLQRDLPKKWEKHGDLAILPNNCFVCPEWRLLGRDLWKIVAESMNVTRVCRKRKIADDEFRTPHIDLLFGKDGWVVHVDNGVSYHYDVTKCMFSIGNISEKLRIANFDCKGETVVDLFAGIGYFTLPYMVHANASYVYGIDWNPDAIEALKRNLIDNKVSEQCTVLEGDCRKVCPSGVADRVNLGLLPTAKQYWLTACKALKRTGGVLHIHDTLTDAKMLHLKQRRDSSQQMQRTISNDSTNTTSSTSKETSPAREISNGVTHNGVTENSDLPTPLPTEEPKKRKFSRSQSILEEIAAKIPPPPCIDETFRCEKWDLIDPSWRQFSIDCAKAVCKFLNNLYDIEGQRWVCTILRIGKIKSYAPHIDHIVLDLHCKPELEENLNFEQTFESES